MNQRKRVSRTYVLPVETADACKSLATAAGTNVSQMVETLLGAAIDAVASGRWSVETFPTRHNARVVTDRPKVDRK